MKRPIRNMLFCGLTTAILGAGPSQISEAAIVASFADGTAVDSAALVDGAAFTGVTVSSLSNVGFESGTNITRNEFQAPSTPGGDEWLLARASVVGSTPSATTDYFGFTISPDAGNRLDLTTLSFDVTNRANTGGGLTSRFQVFAEVGGTGGFSAVGTTSTLPVAASVNTFTPVGTESVDFSSFSLDPSESIEIRIALADDSSSTIKGTFIQNIQLDGNVTAVPEPASLGLLAVGAMGALSRRRRQRQR